MRGRKSTSRIDEQAARMMPGPNLFPPCCTARKTSSEIKDLLPFLDRLSRTTLSTGKFTGDDLVFRLALTTLQFPNVLKRLRTELKALDAGQRSTTSRLIQGYHQPLDPPPSGRAVGRCKGNPSKLDTERHDAESA